MSNKYDDIVISCQIWLTPIMNTMMMMMMTVIMTVIIIVTMTIKMCLFL